MDESLKASAEQFKVVITDLIEQEEVEYNKYLEKVKQLNYELQTNKDLKTDRSENNSFKITQENRDIAQNMLNTSGQLVESLRSELEVYQPGSTAKLGSTVELRLIAIDGVTPTNIHNTNFIIKLVKPRSRKASKNLVSIESPVGSALMGRMVGETITAIAQGGRIQYKIERMY